jgi:hypothetical protein
MKEEEECDGNGKALRAHTRIMRYKNTQNKINKINKIEENKKNEKDHEDNEEVGIHLAVVAARPTPLLNP